MPELELDIGLTLEAPAVCLGVSLEPAPNDCDKLLFMILDHAVKCYLAEEMPGETLGIRVFRDYQAEPVFPAVVFTKVGEQRIDTMSGHVTTSEIFSVASRASLGEVDAGVPDSFFDGQRLANMLDSVIRKALDSYDEIQCQLALKAMVPPPARRILAISGPTAETDDNLAAENIFFRAREVEIACV